MNLRDLMRLLPEVSAKLVSPAAVPGSAGKDFLEQQIYLERLYPYNEAGKVALIRQWGQLLEEEFLPEGIQIRAYVPKEIYGKI